MYIKSVMIKDVDPVSRKITVIMNGNEKTLIAGDEDVLKIADIFRNRKATIVYEEKGGSPILKIVRGELKVELLGLSKDAESEVVLFDEGSKPLSSIGYIDISFIDIWGESLLYLLAVILLVAILITIYFVIIYPLILIISSILTLGETWRMRRVTKITMSVDSSNKVSIENIKKLLSIAVKNKASISINPRRMLPRNLSEYLDRTNKIFRLFRLGFMIQVVIIYTGIILAGMIYFLKMPITQEVKYLAIGLGVIFLVGLFLTVVAGHMRRVLRVPSVIEL